MSQLKALVVCAEPGTSPEVAEFVPHPELHSKESKVSRSQTSICPRIQEDLEVPVVWETNLAVKCAFYDPGKRSN